MDIASYRPPVISSFLAFLLALVALLIIHPLVGHFDLDRRLFEAAFFLTLAGGGLMAMETRRHSVGIVLLFALTIIFRWATMFTGPESALAAGAYISSSAFFFFVAALMLRRVLATERVTADTLYGSVAVYLMMALCFAFIYELIEFVAPASFIEGEKPAFLFSEGGFGDYVYFSLETITTLGYGDLTPSLPLARVVAGLEAVIGQIYVAVLVGRLVGMHLETRHTARGE